MSSIKVNCGNTEISNDNKICIIAGPCQLETEQHAMDMAGKIKEITDFYPLVKISEACRAPGLTSLRLACLTHTRCPAPCTRAHACRARSTRTHHACAPRQPCTCSHVTTRAHFKKLGCRARVTGLWLPVGRLAAGTSGANALCKHARHLRCARGTCVVHTLCMPSTTDVVVTTDIVVCRDMVMTMSEMKTNELMKKTEITMDDASECVLARACGSHVPNRMRSHDAKPVAPEQSKNPCNAHRHCARHPTGCSPHREPLPSAAGSR